MIASTDKQLRKRDLLISVLLCLPIFILYLTAGDAIFVGWIYYLLVVGLPILLVLPFKPPAYFLSGISLSANVGLWFFWFWCDYTLKNGTNDGLLGLYHALFFLPAWALVWLGLVFFQRKKDFSPLKHFLLAFLLPSFIAFGVIGLVYINVMYF